MLAVDEGDERKAEQIGQALIQKGRLAVLPADIHLILDERGPSLIIRFADDAAERFLVDEVAPASQRLRDQDIGKDRVHDAQPVHLHAAEVPQAEGHARDQTAVNGQSALPDIKDADGIGYVSFPLEDHIVQPGADDGDQQHRHKEIF